MSEAQLNAAKDQEEVKPDDKDDSVQVLTPSRGFRFTLNDEIDLLKEVINEEPYLAGHGEISSKWKTIANKFNGKCSWRGAQTHFKELLNDFKSTDSKNKKKTGTEEEYTEFQALLQDIVDRMATPGEKKGIKAKVEQESKVKGQKIRDAAMEGLAHDGPDRSPPRKRKREDRILDLMERKIALEERKQALEEEKQKDLRELLKRSILKSLKNIQITNWYQN